MAKQSRKEMKKLANGRSMETHRQRLALAPAVQHPSKCCLAAINVSVSIMMSHYSGYGSGESLLTRRAAFGPCCENSVGLS
jgi:hypothetical protein